MRPSTAPKIHVLEAEVFSRTAPMRIPFRFGASTMTSVTILYLRALLEDEHGVTAPGIGASLLSPLWFDKRAGRSVEERTRDLLRSVSLAREEYCVDPSRTALELHEAAGAPISARAGELDLPPLVASFGVALLDGAVVDGLCRLAGKTFHAGLRENLFGCGEDLARRIPERPRRSLDVRHTIGLVDPLRSEELSFRLQDGLPETLEEVIRGYGVRLFKIKIPGDSEAAMERLRRIAEVLDEMAGDYRVTLDGNEQLPSAESLHALVTRAAEDEPIASLWARTLWIEQPLARDAALREEVAPLLHEIRDTKPVILDESDGSDDTVDAALRLGYGGISSKYCKGVFRALHSHRTIHEWNDRRGARAELCAEDLTSPAVHPFHFDTCLVAALGMLQAERNAHHYLHGLSFLTEREQREALDRYPSLYERRAEGLVALRIREGRIDVREINAGGFGATGEPEWSELEHVTLPDPGGCAA